MAHREAIESHLFEASMGLFDLQPTVTLYGRYVEIAGAAAAGLPNRVRRRRWLYQSRRRRVVILRGGTGTARSGSRPRPSAQHAWLSRSPLLHPATGLPGQGAQGFNRCQ